MKKLILVAALIAGVACGCGTQKKSLLESETPLAVLMAQSEIMRNPSPMQLDGIEKGKIKWNYTTGLELLAMMDAAKVYNRPGLYDYATRYYDSIISPAGEILTYKRSNYNIDHICPARPLFEIYERTGEVRYKMVLDSLFAQIKEQPRNTDGGFWHKKIYPSQMWLDGLYMGEPFYAEYVNRFIRTQEGMAWREYCDDIVNQFVVAAKHTHDPATGLYRHAYDESRAMFWCDTTTGQSAHAWGRAMGWYAMAIVETLQYLGVNEQTQPLVDILHHIYATLPKYADPVSGMWYQVLDQPGREGNYLESTASIMFTYAQLKGIRLGYLPAEQAAEATRRYEQFVSCFMRDNYDGTISMTGCCAVAGLGGKEQRSGTFDYYISEPVIENDCKGVGPFIWASIEYDRAKGLVK